MQDSKEFFFEIKDTTVKSKLVNSSLLNEDTRKPLRLTYICNDDCLRSKS